MLKPADNGNYYDVLRLSRDASAETIRRQYRRLMQTEGNHPDLGGDPQKAALINKAYAVLSNARRRADYDRQLSIISFKFRVQRAQAEPAAAQRPRWVIDPARACSFCDLPHRHGPVADVDVTCDRCGSPLRGADRLRLEPAGQRKVNRVQKSIRVTVFTSWRQKIGTPGYTEDASPSGLRLVTRRCIPSGERIRIVSGMLDAVGIVTHSTARRRGWRTEHVAGVSFVTLRLERTVGGFVSRKV